MVSPELDVQSRKSSFLAGRVGLKVPALVLCFFLGLSSVQVNAAPPGNMSRRSIDHTNLRADEVLVIANRASKDSVSVARYYMERRKIPKENFFTVDFPNYKHPRRISHEDFQKKIVIPLKQYLESHRLKETILCFVLIYDVPYRVAAPVGPPAVLRKALESKIRALEAQFHAAEGEDGEKEVLRKEGKTEEGLFKSAGDFLDDLVKVFDPRYRHRAKLLLTAQASVDSELAWLYRADVYPNPPGDISRKGAYFGQSRNFYFGQGVKFRQFREILLSSGASEKIGLPYLTARLEGPTTAIAKGLVDLAIRAEREGPSGIGCFDARGPTIGKIKQGYDLGEAWVRRAYIETRNAGFESILDEEAGLFGKGACRNTFFYWGWYALRNYKNAFQSKFAPGAFAVHTASGEASDIRHFSSEGPKPWCAGFLAHGAAFCSGPVAEPFLDAFPHADLFYPRILNGWSAAEAYWVSTAYTSWMMVMIGDPLYAPFSGKNQPETYTSGAIQFKPERDALDMPVLSEKTRYKVVLYLKGLRPLFNETGRYRIMDFKTNSPETFHLKNLDKTEFEIGEQGRLLVIQGPTFVVGQTGALKTGELEVTIDLGPDVGKKIISQRFSIKMPHTMNSGTGSQKSE